MSDDDTPCTATDMAALGVELAAAFEEIRGLDCPGNINVDIPAMVLTDLAPIRFAHAPMGRDTGRVSH